MPFGKHSAHMANYSRVYKTMKLYKAQQVTAINIFSINFTYRFICTTKDEQEALKFHLLMLCFF